MLKEGERLDDLMLNGLKVIQKQQGFRFGTDSVLLSHFVRVKKGERLVELGAGSGAISLLIAGRAAQCTFDLVEIQPDVCDMLRRSIALNAMDARMHLHEMDLKDAPQALGYGRYHVVYINPPYDEMGSAILNAQTPNAIARHETATTIAHIAQSSAGLLQNGGRFYIIQRAERFLPIADALRSAQLEPKRCVFIHAKHDKRAGLFLLECVKGARPGLTFDVPLYVRDESGEISRRVSAIYAGESV